MLASVIAFYHSIQADPSYKVRYRDLIRAFDLYIHNFLGKVSNF
jgi:hypothetical protein